MKNERSWIFLAIPILTLFPPITFADWKFHQEKDAMSDVVRPSASAVNATGHTLSVWLASDNEIWLQLSIPQSSSETLADHLPMFRIDDLKAHDPEEIRQIANDLSTAFSITKERYDINVDGLDSRDVAKVEVHPTWVAIERETSIISELTEGESVQVRYYTTRGREIDTNFTLRGAASAIGKVMELMSNP
tara:strand:+ start:1135 stop:1707 length:573 start_codon:yes stop_codon:yes gene_type:complete